MFDLMRGGRVAALRAEPQEHSCPTCGRPTDHGGRPQDPDDPNDPYVGGAPLSAVREAMASPQEREPFLKAVRRLVVCARTTGGTLGPDAGLMKACEDVENLLCAKPKATGEQS